MSIDVNVQNDLVIVTETTEDIVVNVSNAAGPQGPAGAAGVGVPVGGTTGQVLKKFTNTNYDTYWAADASGLTSVGLSVPMGLTVTNSPLTTNGTIAVGLASGYSIPTTASQAAWDAAYNDKINSAAVTGTTTKILTLNQQDGGTITASWTDDNTDAVTSVFGRTGAVVATEGDYTLTQLGDVTLTSPTNGQVLKYNGTTWVNNTDTDTGLTSVGLSMPSAFSVSNSPLTSNGTIAVTGAGTSAQYVRGDGQLANFPTNGGGGSSVNYYLNGSVSQGTFGGDTYYEMSKSPIIGAGTNFTRTNAQGNGYIASFITDAGDPGLLNIPGGNWNVEFYFQASSGGGNPSFYAEIYKVSSANVFTLIASGSTNPEGITNGTAVDQYFTSIPVPQTSLLSTDRLAIRIYVALDGRNITLHTENSNLCEVLTTFSTGLNALNGLTEQVQYFATGTSGTDFAISSATDTHTFNLPIASGTNTGKLSNTDWTTFNSKQNAITLTTTGTSGASTFISNTLNVPTYTLSGLGGVPTSRTLTINGTAYDLSADRSWTVSGSATPAGSNTQIQYNNSGVFGGSPGLTYTESTGVMTLEKNQNAQTLLTISNTTSGTASQSTLSTVTDSSAGLFNFGKYSSTTVASKIVNPKDAYLYNAVSGDIAILNDSSTGKIKFASGSALTSQMTLTAAGRLLLGTVSESTYILDVNNGTARMNGSSTSRSGLEVGTLNFQYFATNNAFIAENSFYNGSAFQRVNTGLSSVFYFAGGGFQVGTLPSGTGGTTQALLNARMSLTNTGSLAISDTISGGGSITHLASAVLQVDSTTKGFLPPRMNTTEKNAIGSPAAGLVVYDTLTNKLCCYNGTSWNDLF